MSSANFVNGLLGPLKLAVEAYCRPTGEDGEKLITVCLVNRTKDGRGNNQRGLFQSEFTVSFETDAPFACVRPYPKAELTELDEEEQSLELLYRDFETFAIGHGCAADWDQANSANLINTVSAVALPSYETPSITPTIRREDGTDVEVPMAPLAGLTPGDDGWASLVEVLDRYEAWIGLVTV